MDVRPGQEAGFERDFAVALAWIGGAAGYVSHELHRCLETSNRYALLVRWQTLEAHTKGFRESPEYLNWKKILHPYYDPFPIVEHYAMVNDSGPRAGGLK